MIHRDDVARYNKEVLKQRYEGIMICDPDSHYTEGKGKWMWKWKPVFSHEYAFVRLVPATEGRNLATFAAIELAMPNGATFRCSGITDEERVSLMKNTPAPGTPITVIYGDTSEDGVPIFPRFKSVRWPQ